MPRLQVGEAHVRALTAAHHRRTTCVRWLLNFIIAILVGAIAVLIIYCSLQLSNLRYNAVYNLIDGEQAGSLPMGVAFIVFWVVGLAYALVASFPVLMIEPSAGGAGIPEVKMILNGVKMPRVTRIKTLVCRVFGNIFSVASGLPGASCSPPSIPLLGTPTTPHPTPHPSPPTPPHLQPGTKAP